MNSINYQYSLDSNAYSMPVDRNVQNESEELVPAEFQLQMVLLNNRVDILSNMLKELLSHNLQNKPITTI